MRVALDVSPVVAGNTGSARFTQELWNELLRRPSIDLRPLAVGRGRDPALPVKRLHWPLRVAHATWKTVRWPSAESLVGEVDVVHSMDLTPPPTRSRLVVTVNDALSVTHPQFLPRRSIRLQHRQLAAARAADAVVAISQATADTLVQILGVAAERVVVAPLAPGVDPPRTADSRATDPYVLAVGSVTPRKGFETLARAAALVGSSFPMVLIAGPDGWNADVVRAAVDEIDTAGRVRFLGGVSDEELQRLYANATIVCHPSLAEGFGIVCLEAMACGVAVVTSDLPSVREFAGDAVLYATPDRPESFAEHLQELMTNSELRRSLGERGRAQTQSFTWERTTDCVLRAYERSLAGAPS